jgi:DsbC/DsbD-like thiol-disulfide interchange protein
MRHIYPRQFALPAVAAVVSAFLALTTPVQAADASAWARENHAAMRLIAGSAKLNAKVLHAGIELQLESGWHTYWRYPGDSGLPPRFDFSGSQNLAAAKVSYPAPHLYADETGNTLGYKNKVIFPVSVTPKQPGQPVKLHVKIDYAICAKLCVPASGQAELMLSAGTSANEAILAAAEAQVPKPVTPAKLGLTLKRTSEEQKPAVAVDIAAPKDQPVQLFVEGPSGEWALPVPKEIVGAPNGRRQFSFILDGLPPGVSPKAPAELTFTVVEGDQAFETKAHLD